MKLLTTLLICTALVLLSGCAFNRISEVGVDAQTQQGTKHTTTSLLIGYRSTAELNQGEDSVTTSTDHECEAE